MSERIDCGDDAVILVCGKHDISARVDSSDDEPRSAIEPVEFECGCRTDATGQLWHAPDCLALACRTRLS